MKKYLCILAALLMLGSGIAAETRDDLLHPFKIGITAGTGMRLYTGVPYLLPEDIWVGVLLHIIPAFALRPSLVFYKQDGEIIYNVPPSFTKPTTSADGGLGGALGAFYFSRPKQNFMLYLGPEVKFYFSSEIDFYDNGDKESDYLTQQLTAAVLIGTQYMLSERFGFQADAGLGMLRYYRHDREWDDLGTKDVDSETTETTFFLRPAYLGAVFYFN